MKKAKIAGVVSIGFGVLAFAGLLISIVDTLEFIDESTLTNGVVVEIVTSSGTDSNGDFPVVRFEDKAGNTIEKRSSSSNWSGAVVGDIVEVRYIEGYETHAIISSFILDMWGLSFFIAFFTLLLSGLGISFYWVGVRDKVMERRALLYTNIISAEVTQIIYNTNIRVNKRSPYYIEAQWIQPGTNEVHLFRSKNIWYNPTDYVDEKVKVKTDPRNIKKYWMDVSFLPNKNL